MFFDKFKQNSAFLIDKVSSKALLILIFAYTIRVIYPDVHFAGGDYPGHVMASLRLNDTFLFELKPLMNNLFAQIFEFNHGYTTIIFPYILYKICFNIFGIPMNEASFVYINSLIGIFSIFSVYLFVKEVFNKNIAIWTILLVTVLPIHIGLSRVHVGTQIISMAFFWLSLFFLSKLLKNNTTQYKLLYFIITFFYIGSDNLFFIGLFFHLVFIYTKMDNYRGFVTTSNAIYKNLYILFILIPVFTYITVAIISIRMNIEHGFLLRLFSKVDNGNNVNSGMYFGVYLKYIWIRLGVVGILSLPIIVIFIKKIFNKKELIFLFYYFLLFSFIVVIKGKTIESNYISFLSVPIVVFIVHFLRNRFLIILMFVSLLLSIKIVYNIPKIFTLNVTNYGSINHDIVNNNYGIKTLSYLVRKNILNIDKQEKRKHGIVKNKIALYLDYEGAWWYLGTRCYDWVIRDINLTGSFKRFAIAIRESGFYSKRNEFLKMYVKNNKLYQFGYIVNKEQKLITIYTNYKPESINYYETNQYDILFDEKYYNMKTFPKVWLGHF